MHGSLLFSLFYGLALFKIQHASGQLINRGIVYSNESVEHTLLKRDPSFVAANIASEGCALINKHYATSKVNKKIQMAECYLNSRIDHQRFVVYEPDDGNMLASREFGPYGTCYAFSDWPQASMLHYFENKNYACFGWTKKGPDHKGINTPPKFPGTPFIPPPIGCPHNLVGCYSKGVYNPGGKLAALANVKSTFSGLIIGPKDAKGNPLWCGACPIGTNWQMQTENIAKLHCDTRKCANYKYQGSTTLMNPTSLGNTAQSNAQTTSANTGSGAAGGGKSLLGSLMGSGGDSTAGAATPVVGGGGAPKTQSSSKGTSLLGSLFGGGGSSDTSNTNPSLANGVASTNTPVASTAGKSNILGGGGSSASLASKNSKASAGVKTPTPYELARRQRSKFRHRRGLRRRF